jgi:ornithine cyclodeaminase/alanine dehydrogenase-like protein (mu-crystallin family)
MPHWVEFEDVEAAGLLRWSELIELTERALGDLASHGEQVNHPRRRLHCPSLTRISIHAGAYMPYDLLGMMVHSELPVVSEGGKPLPAQIVRGRGDYVYVLYEAGSAQLAAVVRRKRDQKALDYRTAATSIVGTKRLIREGSGNLALFGSSHQARSHLEALADCVALRRVRVFSPTAEHRKAFSAEMSRRLSLEILPAESPRECVKDADIVIEASNTAQPVFDGLSLGQGMHVTSIAGSNRELAAQQKVVRRALDEETIRRSDVIFVTLKEQTRQDQQGEIFHAIRQGALDWNRVRDIGDLVLGKTKGREKDSQITLYNNNAGMGVVDVALAGHVYRLARDQGLYKEI